MVKSRLNRFTAMLLSVIMIFSSFSAWTSTQAEAASKEITVKLTDTNIRWAKTVTFYEPYSQKNWTHWQNQSRHIMRISETNTVAYCIQPGTYMYDWGAGSVPTLSTNYPDAWKSLSEDQQDAIKLAMYFGFPNKNTALSGTAEEQEVATQLIIWEFICGYRDCINYNLTDYRFIKAMCDNDYSQNKGVYQAYNQIEQAMFNYNKIMSFANMTQNNANVYTLKWDGTKYTITLTDTNNVLDKYTLSCVNPDVKFSSSGNKLTISTVNPLSSTVMVRAKTTASSESNNTIVYGHHNSEIQAVIDQATADKPDPVFGYIKINTEATGSLKVFKEYQDMQGNPVNETIEYSVLNNTKFKIITSAGKYIQATYPGGGTKYSYKALAESASDGTVFTPKSLNNSFFFEVDKLPVGTYTIVEQDNNISGYYTQGSKNVNISVTANSTKTITFKNRPSQLIINKSFVQFNAVTNDDYKKVTMQISQKNAVGETSNINAICVDDENNIYQYVSNISDMVYRGLTVTSELKFINPKVHNITVIGLPITNGNDFYYQYTVSEVNNASLSKRYTYNDFTCTFETGNNISGTIINNEKSIGYIEIEKDFKVENTDGTRIDFAGNEKLSLKEAYADISFTVKNSQGKYIKANYTGPNYVYAGLTSSVSEATKFSFIGDYRKVRINNLPFGTYSVTEISGNKVKGQGFRVEGSSAKSVMTSYDILNDTVKGGYVKFTNVKQQFVGLRIYKTFVDNNDESIDVSNKIYSQVEFSIYDRTGKLVQVTLNNKNAGAYSVFKENSGFPQNTMQLGTDTKSITVTGLQSGQKYTVKERVFDSLKNICVCKSSFTVEGDTENTVVFADADSIEQSNTVTMPTGENSVASVYFTNTYKTTELQIYKESDDDLVERKFAVTTVNYDLYPETAPLYVTTEKITGTDGKIRGMAVCKDLPLAFYDSETDSIVKIQYKIEEVETPDYYEIPKAQTIIPMDNQNSVTFKNVLKKGKIKVIKKAKVNGSDEIVALEGVEFKLNNSLNNKFLTGITDKNGEILFENLPVAVGVKDVDGNETIKHIKYTVTELAGENNKQYVLSEKQSLTLAYMPEESKRIKTVEIVNTPITGNIYLDKADEISKELLSGAEFTLYNDINSNGKYDESDTLAMGYIISTDDSGNTIYTPSNTLIEKDMGHYELSSIPKGKYILVETKNPVGYVADKKEFAFEISEPESTIQIHEDSPEKLVYNKPIFGSVHLSKVDKTNNQKLSGAKFRIWKDTNGNGKLDTKTDETFGLMTEINAGEYEMQNLPYGNYFVVERIAPEGYIRSGKTYTFSITENSAVVEVGDIPNTPIKGNVSVVKIDSLTKEQLKGAEFTVYNDVDKDGIITANIDTVYGKLIEGNDMKYYLNDLPYGEYVLAETKAPIGHILNKKVYPFQIIDNGVTVEVNDDGEMGILNEPIQGSIRVVKIDGTTEKSLQGAEFTLYNSDNEAVKTLTTNADGIVDFGKIRYGKYTVKETTAPKHYILDDTPIPFEVLENEKIYGYTHKNTPEYGKGKFIKTSEDGIIEGVTFHIYGTSNTGVAVDETVVTDKNGSVSLELLTGTYTVEEIKVAERYIAPSPQHITVKANKTSTVKFENVLKKGGLMIEKINSKHPEIKISGAVFTVYKGDGTKYADVPEVATGIYSLTDIPHGTYIVKEISAPTGYILDNGSYSFEIKTAEQVVTVANNEKGKFMEVPIEGSIEILKVDGTNSKPLAGAEFTLYDINDDDIQTLTTGSDGKVIFKDVFYGKYTVRETKAPKYYALDNTPIPFEILENGKILTVTKKNTPEYGKGKFIKTSEDGMIEGITFHIYGTSNTGVTVDETVVTDKNGSVSLELLTGKYTVEEIKIFDRYVVPAKQTIVIKNGQTSTVTFNNVLKKGKVRLEKVSSKSTETKLSGAKFTVYRNDGTKYADLSENETGIYTLQNIPYGSYTVKEIVAPTGYLLDTASYSFKITQDKQTIIISNSDNGKFEEIRIEGSIEILKVDNTNNKPLAGAEFTLYDVDENKIQTLTTGKDGKVTFKEVPYGKYTVKETKAPKYYELDSTPIPFEILENGKTLTVTKKNTPEYGKGEFVKTSEDGIIKNVTLHIYGTSNTGVKVDETVVTDKNGSVSLELLTGAYTVEEIKIADRYVAVPKQTIKIENGKTSTVTFNNVLKKGKLIIEKVSSKNPDMKLTGALFTVFDSDGNKVSDLSETEKGIYTISNLLYGSYTVKETTAPTGYLLDKCVYKFDITKDNQVIVISNSDDGKFIEIPIEGSIEILKVDSTNSKPLVGAEFTLYDSESNVIQTLTTGKDGKVTFKEVPYGKYTVRETKALKYYELDSTPIPFEILENGKTLTVTKKNTPEYGKGSFIKTSEDGIIENVTLHICGTSNTGVEVDETVTTDAEGKANLKLLVGTYTIEEIKVADRYVTVPKQAIKIEKNKTAEVKFNNVLKKGKLIIEKVSSKNPDIKLTGALFTVFDNDGNKVSDLIETEKGIYSLSNLLYGSYTVKEMTAPTGYLLDKGVYEFDITKDNQVIVISNSDDGKFVEIPIEGSIEVLKVDSINSKPLSGAEFTLYDLENNVIQTLTTGKDGKATFNKVPYGKYIVKETKAPKYYELDSTPIPFEILENGKTLTVTKKNTPEYGKGSLIKTSEDGVIEGITFHIYGTSNTGVTVDGTVVTDKNGSVSLELLTGKYTVEEIKVADRYVSVPKQTIKIEKNKTTEVKFSNILKKGSVQLYKIDEGYPENKLSGAVFEVYDSDKNTVGTLVEIEKGLYRLDNLIYGDYTLKEITAPVGFMPDTNEYEFKILKNDEVVTVETMPRMGFSNKPIKGSFSMYKIDGNTQKPLQGAEFTLYDMNNNALKTAVTDENGYLEFTNLRYGSYYIKETKAPDNYELNDLPYGFQVFENGKVIEYKRSNSSEKGNLEIIKKSNDGIVENVKFHIFGKSLTMQEVDEIAYTDENGRILIKNLMTGTYTVEELEVNDRYIMPQSQTVTVLANETAVVEFTNILKRGSVRTTKVDKDYPENKLSGAVFEIFDNDKNSVGIMQEIETGIYQLDELVYGDYTLKEITAPIGFKLDENEYPFEIRENGELKVIETLAGIGFINDAQKGDLLIQKRSSDGKLEGFSFRVTGTTVTGQDYDQIFVTDKDGRIEVKDLRIGTYTVSEISDEMTVRYTLPADETVEIISDNVTEIEMYNDEFEIPFEITKSDISTGELISNCGFRIRNSNGEIIIEGYTDENGIAKFELVCGEYTYQEFDAPDGYIIDESEYPFTINPDDTIVKANMTNVGTGTFEMTKTDISTGRPIPDTSFRIRNDKGEIVVEGKTDSNGIARFEKLPYGKYTYQEFDAPDGYIIDESEYPFEVKENNEVVKAEMQNIGTGTFEMTKNDISTGRPIPDTSFRIRNDKGEIVVEGKTNSNGIARFEKLPYGKYTYQEFDAPDGYIIDESEYPFEINENNEVVKAEMKNIGTGTIIITKRDISNGKVIPDCEIEILDENKKVIFRGKTDKNGIVEFEKLPYGKYFYREFNAPKGYILDETPFAFEIKENGEIIKAEMTNKPIEKTPGYITTSDNSMVYAQILMFIILISLVIIFAFRKSSKK